AEGPAPSAPGQTGRRHHHGHPGPALRDLPHAGAARRDAPHEPPLARPAVSQEENDDLLEDDNFHDPETSEWWEHETLWFWWFNAERKLGAWHYHYLRPNIGITGGGLFVFDDTAWFHMEVPYYFNWTNMPLPAERDLRDFTF